jgi:HK97 family phage major capsid protein
MKTFLYILNMLCLNLVGCGIIKLTLGITDDEFQKKVLDGVKDLKSAQEEQGNKLKTIEDQKKELTCNYENLDNKTKQAFEDLTKLKNSANDVSATLNAVKRVQAQLKLERRAAFGDPVQRLLADEEKRYRINAAVRRAVSRDGDMQDVVKAIMGKALGEDSSPGSTMIDDALLREIYDTLASYGVWNTFGVRRMGTKTTKMPVQTARPVANFITTEGGTISDDSNKAGTSVSLEVEVIAVLLNVSLQLIQDSEFDVAADVLNDFVEAFNYRLDWAALQADGTADATDGGMTGAFQGGTAATAASGNTTMETLDFEDVTNCLLSVDSAVLSRAARWWMHPQILVRMLHIKDSNGRPIFLTANEAPAPGGIGSILGYPVTLAEAAPSANEASAKVAVFGDPNALVVGVRQDFGFEASDHHKWSELQRSFRAYGRAGVKIRRSNGLSVLTTAAS